MPRRRKVKDKLNLAVVLILCLFVGLGAFVLSKGGLFTYSPKAFDSQLEPTPFVPSEYDACKFVSYIFAPRIERVGSGPACSRTMSFNFGCYRTSRVKLYNSKQNPSEDILNYSCRIIRTYDNNQVDVLCEGALSCNLSDEEIERKLIDMARAMCGCRVEQITNPIQPTSIRLP